MFDLHANFSPRMADFANALVTYRDNPHSDARETAVRAANLLARSLKSGERPRMVSRHAGIIWPPTGTGTADRPMRDLERLAREIEASNPQIWAVNVIGGYAFSDVADAGVSFSLVTTADEAVAQEALDRLVLLANELRDLGLPSDQPIDEVIAGLDPSSDGPISSSSRPTTSEAARREIARECCGRCCGTGSSGRSSPSMIPKP